MSSLWKMTPLYFPFIPGLPHLPVWESVWKQPFTICIKALNCTHTVRHTNAQLWISSILKECICNTDVLMDSNTNSDCMTSSIPIKTAHPASNAMSGPPMGDGGISGTLTCMVHLQGLSKKTMTSIYHFKDQKAKLLLVVTAWSQSALFC